MNFRVFTKSLIIGAFISFSIQAIEITLDGRLSEDKWHTTPKMLLNYQVIPQTLDKENNNFSYKILTTSLGLFLGLEAKIQNSLRMRTQENDTEFSNDHFQIILDINNNAQDSYVFAINHQGNYFDGELNSDKSLDLDWSAQWEFSVNVNKNDWTAEIFIPWNVMSFSIMERNDFGIYISRFDENTNVTYATAPTNKSMNSFYQKFTPYSANIQSKKSFNLFPYMSWNRDMLNNKNLTSFGTEIFWQPTKGQRLSATFNPDFGQIESDELVVNFSAIESFFTEKRPFFNNNQSLFDVEGPETLRLVHSPRIGGVSFYDDSYSGDLNSALKYTVNKPNYDFGFLSAFENSTAKGSGRDFYVLRGQYSLDSSNIGISFNHVKTPNINRKSTVLSSDLLYAITEDTSINLGFIRSNIKVNNNSQHGIGWWFTGSSDASELHSHEFSLFSYGENLQLNDVGFVKRVNRKQLEYEYQYQIPHLASELIRDMTFSVETELKTNYQNEKLPHVLGAGIELVTEVGFEYQFSIEMISSGLDDLTTRGNNSIWLPTAHVFEFELASSEYSWGKYALEITSGEEGWNGQFYDVTASIEQQLSESLHLGISLSQYNSDSWIEWDEENIIEEYNYTEQGVELNLNYQIDSVQALRLKFEAVIGKAQGIASYLVHTDGTSQLNSNADSLSFSENALQLRYKYTLSKLTALYLSYSFAGEYEDNHANFGERNLYRRALNTKKTHSFFAKIRLHF